jgi:type III secretion protein R
MKQRKVRRRRAVVAGTLIGLAVSLAGATAYAQGGLNRLMGNESITNRPILLLVAISGLALVPFVLIMVTSFVKIAVVLSIIRQAIGTQQIPPTQVITGLAIILTVYIMTPVGLDMYKSAQKVMLTEFRGQNVSWEKMTVEAMTAVARESQHPLRQFLIKHAHLKDRDMFYKIAYKMRKPEDRATLTDEDYTIIVPAFVISELKEAFQIGFILFVPFLVIDMVVSNILMALGMQMLSPTTISLPFKILLFVLVDGWYLITRGLVLGYQ